MSCIDNVPGSPSVMSPVVIENPTCSGLTWKNDEDKKKHSVANHLSETQSKILLDYMCKQAEGRQKRREAGNLDPNDPEDILCSLVSLEPLAPACQKNSSYEYTGEYLEKKKKISHRTPLFSLWISECREREKTSKLSFYEQRQIWQKIKAQLESSEFVPGSPSVMSPVDIENPTCSGLTLKTVKDKKKHSFACRLSETQSKILLDYMCKQAKDRQKRREAGNL
ncbi:uncharacterized protein LOC122856876 isoform X1 [Aphidius gifuensis]|uniref:uncharacterized protein LOC122856876 isoform X1 n=1 Tax=Aphidius gifuensis TaxID=684658 RepID=UPI001CDC3C15|nr:uncharacterized protein LOC122856876 isoform X1 [Aphidius gifuensis]